MTLIVLASASIGAFSGVHFYKKLLTANAAGYWMKGVESLNAKEYDYALLYFTQAIALKNDEPFFLHSMAEVYEVQQNLPLALEFYKLALSEYAKGKTGPIKFIEHKIKLLEVRIKEKGKT